MINVVLRVVLDTDKAELKNFIMNFYRIRERNLRKLIPFYVVTIVFSNRMVYNI